MSWCRSVGGGIFDFLRGCSASLVKLASRSYERGCQEKFFVTASPTCDMGLRRTPSSSRWECGKSWKTPPAAGARLFHAFHQRVISTATLGAGLLVPLQLPGRNGAGAGRVKVISRSRGLHRATATTSAMAETRQLTGWGVPTMVLGETRSLQLYRVIRGGLGSDWRLARRGETRPNG